MIYSLWIYGCILFSCFKFNQLLFCAFSDFFWLDFCFVSSWLISCCCVVVVVVVVLPPPLLLDCCQVTPPPSSATPSSSAGPTLAPLPRSTETHTPPPKSFPRICLPLLPLTPTHSPFLGSPHLGTFLSLSLLLLCVLLLCPLLLLLLLSPLLRSSKVRQVHTVVSL